MLKCSPEAFAKCPTRHFCGVRHDDATFAEGSDCDKFNQEVLAAPKTRVDRIRSMSDEALALHHCKFLAAVMDHVGLWFDAEAAKSAILEWLQQPAEVKDNA